MPTKLMGKLRYRESNQSTTDAYRDGRMVLQGRQLLAASDPLLPALPTRLQAE